MRPAPTELLRSTPAEKYVDLVLDGIEVGRIALYEMLIQSKRATLQFNDEEWARYRASLKNVIWCCARCGGCWTS